MNKLSPCSAGKRCDDIVQMLAQSRIDFDLLLKEDCEAGSGRIRGYHDVSIQMSNTSPVQDSTRLYYLVSAQTFGIALKSHKHH